MVDEYMHGSSLQFITGIQLNRISDACTGYKIELKKIRGKYCLKRKSK